MRGFPLILFPRAAGDSAGGDIWQGKDKQGSPSERGGLFCVQRG